MAGPATSVASAIGNIFSTLTPGQLFHLNQQISQQDEVRAMSILMSMRANPPGAGMALIGLEGISDLSPQVLAFAQAAASAAARNDQSGFESNMAQATAALNSQKINPFSVALG